MLKITIAFATSILLVAPAFAQGAGPTPDTQQGGKSAKPTSDANSTSDKKDGSMTPRSGNSGGSTSPAKGGSGEPANAK